MKYYQTGMIIDARPLTDDDRKTHNIEDARAGHVGIFHPANGNLLNTMSPEDFKAHYQPLDVSDTAAVQPGTPQAGAPAGSNDPNDKR